MNILITIEHPAWAHQFHYIIKRLIAENHYVKVLLIKKDNNYKILDYYGIDYEVIGHSTGKNIIEMFFLLILYTFRILRISIKSKIDLFTGRATPMLSIVSFLLRKPHIIFEDTEGSFVSLFFAKLFSTRIYTNGSFKKDLGKKHERIPTYKELFYLHPNYFNPDINSLKYLNIAYKDKFILLRFVKWTAHHDIGHKGIKKEDKLKIINRLSKYGKIFISSECTLEPEFKSYGIDIPFEKIHDIIYYSELVFGESATMATESAIIGTPAIFCYFGYRGYTNELRKEYKLIYNFNSDSPGIENAIKKAEEILSDINYKNDFKKNKDKFLKTKDDGSKIFYEKLQHYLDKP